MPLLKTNVGDIPCTDEQYSRFLEKCPRCKGSGSYNYFPHENRLKTLFHRLTGASKCLSCHGSGTVLTEEGKEFVARVDSDMRWKAMQSR